MSHPMQSQTNNRRGFTLAELLVILGIIVLVLVIALPAFSAIGAGRSIAASENLVAAALSRARSEAIRRGVPCGVYFFIDLETERTAMAIVSFDELTDPDPYDEYKAYLSGADYQASSPDPLPDATNEPYMTSDRVRTLAEDNNQDLYAEPNNLRRLRGRPTVLTWTRRNLDGNPANPAVTSPGVVAVAPQRSDGSGVSNGPTAYENDEWVVNTKFPSLEPLPGIDVELLPVGVGVQLITG
ncbi:MAG: prepilin-type N-terminal cleavage/methylation domain-containing protein, partial [Planctomycetota bacterium]